MTHVGCHLFDVFSEHERVKVITNGYAFDEEFLADQRGPRKLRMDTSKVTEEFELDLSQRSERERRHKNYIVGIAVSAQQPQKGPTRYLVDASRCGKGPSSGKTLIQ